MYAICFGLYLIVRPSSGMAIKNLIKEDTIKSRGSLAYSHYFPIILKQIQNIQKIHKSIEEL